MEEPQAGGWEMLDCFIRRVSSADASIYIDLEIMEETVSGVLFGGGYGIGEKPVAA
jgi:hypothetical protein